MRKEEATSASESDLSCESYRGLVSGPHYEEADFEVAFSTGARVIGVVQQEPLPHDTVGCNKTHINVYKDTHKKIQIKLNKVLKIYFRN